MFKSNNAFGIDGISDASESLKVETSEELSAHDLDHVSGGWFYNPEYTQHVISGIINQKSTDGKFATGSALPYYSPLH